MHHHQFDGFIFIGTQVYLTYSLFWMMVVSVSSSLTISFRIGYDIVIKLF